MPALPIRRNVEGFWQAEAFARCDLRKGLQMPDFLCFSDGRPMSMATCRIINEARNDVMHAWYNGGPGTITNPYAYGCISAQLYADVARMALGEDRTPYEVKG